MKTKCREVVDRWHELVDDTEKFLEFAEGLNVNEFTSESGERVVWLEDGNHYIAHGERIGEHDGQKEKEIIEALAECGVEFEKEIEK